MAETYSWHQGNSCLASLWTVSVPLLPDEIISSWLVRAALTQGCDPMVLTGDIWPKWRAWTIDIDRGIPEDRLKILCTIAGISAESFSAATLRTIAKHIHPGQLPEKAIWPWMLTLGSRNTKRRSGMQYCPTCLTEDIKPYFRLQWRFAWHTVCQHHKCSLWDRCWRCHAPVEPHRLMAQDRYESVCATCKAELKKAIAKPCAIDLLSFQMEADQIIQKNSGEYLGKPISVQEWFEVIDFFVALIRRVNRSSSDGLMDFMKHLNIILPKEIPKIAGASIELLCVHDRQKIVVPTWRLFSASKDQLEYALKEAEITRQSICDKKGIVPAHLIELFEPLTNKPITRTSQTKSYPSEPRARHKVIQMMDRLKRKLEMAQR